ncbi:MAG: glutathione S-transferase family protein [Myxococcota bacterium]
MKLYFRPLACSLATRIALYEAGVEADYVRVDSKTKLTSDGRHYPDVFALDQVPLLECEHGFISENAAILQYVAERFPDARLAPVDTLGRARLRQWLSYISSELHKPIFTPLFDRGAPEDVKRYALAKVPSRLGYLTDQLGERRHLLGEFSVADAYLFAILNWKAVTPVELPPALARYHAELGNRPSVARAFAEERELYLAER